jgi:adsorption protein B
MHFEAIDSYVRVLTIAISAAIILNLLDDLFIDLNYFLRGLHRRSRRRLTRAELVSPKQQRIAIIVPAWKEAEVIAEMLEHNLGSIDYDRSRYTFFCGTYQNDPGTQACVDSVARRFPSVRKVVVPHDGPTSKADCLNWVYQGIILDEETSGERYDIVLMHDAEDIIHALSLRLVNHLIPRYDFVQTPVFSLELKLDQVVAGTYIDEFAEHHLKDMLVREAIGGLVPSAGVGSAFARDAFEEIACAHDQKPFNTESLTEDYEIAIKFRLAGKRVHFACRTLERPAEPDGVISAREEYLATREYFPSGASASVRQRSRWVCGITLQTWQQVGWKGPLAVRYCMWRDRKAVITNLVVLLSYVVVLYFAVASSCALITHSDWSVAHIAPAGSLLWYMLWLNSAALVWRASLKAYFVGRLYGPAQALLSVPRLIAGNVIGVLATLRALRQYTMHRITGEPLRWLKTAHQFPNARTLRARARMLGECLLESGLISTAELNQALLIQRGTDLPLGTVLTLSGMCTGDTVLSALSQQWGIESGARVQPETIASVLLRAVPEAEAERLDILPLSTQGSEVAVAVARPLALEERARLEMLVGARIRPSLVDPARLQRARRRAYRRLVTTSVAGQPRLGEQLIAAGHITSTQLETTLAQQAESDELLGELLHRQGLVSAEVIARHLGHWSETASFDRSALDTQAVLRLGYAYCALYSIAPLVAPAGVPRLLACPFPVADAVRERVQRELAEPVALAYASLFQVRAALARTHRSVRAQLATELPGLAALDACELQAVADSGVWPRGVGDLWQRCSAAARAPVDYLETEADMPASMTAELRAHSYRLETSWPIAPATGTNGGAPGAAKLRTQADRLERAGSSLPPSSADGLGPETAASKRPAPSLAPPASSVLPPAAAVGIPSLLPPSWLQRDGIVVLSAADGCAVLAAAKPSPELARAVARCLPTWAIEWRVTSPAPAALGALTQATRNEAWNQPTTVH